MYNDITMRMEEKKTLVAATANENKVRELSSMARPFGYAVISHTKAGEPDFKIDETGETFEENSLLKAQALFDALGGRMAVIADDSGLEVDALDGAPGIMSERFATIAEGANITQDRGNNIKLLSKMEKVPANERTAKFVSVITCILPNKPPIVCRGEIKGTLAFTETGFHGFGYDPLFIPDGYRDTFGLFDPRHKNAISHCGRAFALLAEKLKAEGY